MNQLDLLKEEWLKTHTIKTYGKRKEKKFEPTGILTVYLKDEIQKVL